MKKLCKQSDSLLPDSYTSASLTSLNKTTVTALVDQLISSDIVELSGISQRFLISPALESDDATLRSPSTPFTGEPRTFDDLTAAIINRLKGLV